MDHLRQFLDFHYGLICKFCKAKVMDLDKKKNQMFLDGKCPMCGKHPADEKRRVKEDKKRAKQERKRLAREAHSTEVIRHGRRVVAL